MIKFNIIFKYITLKYIGLLLSTCLLSGCLGGTVAQQIVRSIATSVADKAMAHAMDVEDGPSNRNPNYAEASTPSKSAAQTSSLPQPYKPVISESRSEKALAKQNLENYNLARRSIEQAQYDPYRLAIANTAFQELKPISEPLPTEAAEVESVLQVIQSSQLVRVELFNLLIGEEKNAVYEQARLMGSTSLPQKREWALWQVATGAIQGGNIQASKKQITFLIPPEFGKLPSGAVTMVELASPGELNVARYKAH